MGSVKPKEGVVVIYKDDEALCGIGLFGVYRSVLGAVAWTVLTRAELAAYVQALRRGAHAFRIKGCKWFSFAIGHIKGRKCGFKSVALTHPLELVGLLMQRSLPNQKSQQV